MMIPHKLNTSNKDKQNEFAQFFSYYKHPVTFTNFEVDEITADPVMVVAHKASVIGTNILVEDTSLEVDGHDFGINIKHKIAELPKAIGSAAVWNVFMAFCDENTIFIFKGSVNGHIASKSGASGFGFDPFFIPLGSTKSLAEEKLDQKNARFLCVQAIMTKSIFSIHEKIDLYKNFSLQK